MKPIRYRSLEFLGYPLYKIGSDGTLWSMNGSKLKEWRQIKPTRNKQGRLLVHVSRGGRQITFQVHRLLLLAFVGPCPDGMQCCHWDGDPTNNDLSNLRWDTPKANQQDRLRHGRTQRGEKHHSAKLTEGDVAAIRYLISSKYTSQRKIAKLFKVHPTTVCAISKGRNWWYT